MTRETADDNGHTQAGRILRRGYKTYDWKNVNREWGGIIHFLRREAEWLRMTESGVKEPVVEKRQK